MKFLCIGSGSIGKRHMRNLLTIGIGQENITAVDPRKDRREEILSMGIKNVYESFDEAINSDTYEAQ